MAKAADNNVSYIGLARADPREEASLVARLERIERENNVLRQSVATLEQRTAANDFEKPSWIFVRKLEKVFQITFLPVAALGGVIAALPVVFSFFQPAPEATFVPEPASITAPLERRVPDLQGAFGVSGNQIPPTNMAHSRLKLPEVYRVPRAIDLSELSFPEPPKLPGRSINKPNERSQPPRALLNREIERRRSFLLSCARDPNCP